jgi:hypothetical protein
MLHAQVATFTVRAVPRCGRTAMSVTLRTGTRSRTKVFDVLANPPNSV